MQDMYQYKHYKTELNLLAEAFKENKRLYFLTHFSGVLLYALVLFLNFYWNPFQVQDYIRRTAVSMNLLDGVHIGFEEVLFLFGLVWAFFHL